MSPVLNRPTARSRALGQDVNLQAGTIASKRAVRAPSGELTNERAEYDLQDGEDEDGEADLTMSREKVTANVGRLSLSNVELG